MKRLAMILGMAVIPSLGVILILAVLSAVMGRGQNPPIPAPAPTFPIYTGPYTIATSVWPQYATFTEKIAKNGHYVATFDDPNNEWRCSIASAAPLDNPQSVLIVCIRPSETPVPDERKTEKNERKTEKK